jgi:hypothetical protein
MTTGGALITAIGALCALTDAHTVELRTDQLRVGDVVSLDCLAPEQRPIVGEHALATLERERHITRAALAALARRRVPALVNIDLGGDRDEIVRLSVIPHDPLPLTGDCYVARTALATGAAISADDVEITPCATQPTTRVRYDRAHGVLRAADDIAAGDALGRMIAPSPSVLSAGQSLTLRTEIGPVIIERPVETVQATRGEAVFVRDGDGHVFAASLATEALP